MDLIPQGNKNYIIILNTSHETERRKYIRAELSVLLLQPLFILLLFQFKD
jgi:hypothetical protein